MLNSPGLRGGFDFLALISSIFSYSSLLKFSNENKIRSKESESYLPIGIVWANFSNISRIDLRSVEESLSNLSVFDNFSLRVAISDLSTDMELYSKLC